MNAAGKRHRWIRTLGDEEKKQGQTAGAEGRKQMAGNRLQTI
jgi:hypothetical protein